MRYGEFNLLFTVVFRKAVRGVTSEILLEPIMCFDG